MSASSNQGKKKHGLLWRVCAAFLIIVLLLSGATIAINAYTIASTRDDVHTIAQIDAQSAQADAILVLGASVYADGTPSDMLAHRLEVACDLYFSGAAPTIIVSGDNESSHYNESDAMAAYCMGLGVPESAIVVDPKGYDTYDSVYRAKNVYNAESLMIVTQAYHLYRSLMIAHLLGIDDAEGVAADKGAYNDQKRYSLREVFARDKDFFQALFRVPA